MDSPSLQKIADQAGVSRSTVSRALRNSPLVASPLRERIQRVAKRLGYHSDSRLNELMAHLRKGRSGSASETLAVVTSNAYEEFLRRGSGILGPKYKGMLNRAKELGFQLELFHLGDYEYKSASLSRVLWHRGIRGIAIEGLRMEDAHLKLDWHHFSAVGTSLSLVHPYLHRVCHYYFHSLHVAYEKLWKYGYRRIGLCINHRTDAVSDHNWLSSYLYEGFCRSLKAPPRPFVYDEFKLQGLEKWLNQFRPDAMIVSGPIEMFLDALHRLGYQVPQDISLASLNLKRKDGEIAGIDQRMGLIGEVSVGILSSLIMQNERGIPENPITHQVEGMWRDGKTVRIKFA